METIDALLDRYLRDLLNLLLDRAEQPGRKRSVAVLIRRDCPWYDSEQTPSGLRPQFHEALRELEQRGWLQLSWRKFNEGNLLEKVELVVSASEGMTSLYSELGRVPRETQEARLRALLKEQEPGSEWHTVFLARARAQLEAHHLPVPLSLSDLQESRDLLLALGAIARLREPALLRKLSVQLYHDSKQLGALKNAIVAVLSTCSAQAALYGDDEWALLRAHHIERAPEYVPLAGPITIQVEEREPPSGGMHLELDAQFPSIALSEYCLRLARVIACPASAVVMVENLTSFTDLLLVRPSSLLALYTGGFASPSLLFFLEKLQKFRSDLPFFHWGDLDVGGFRILAHLRAFLRSVQPVGMDIATFTAYQDYGQPLTTRDRDALDSLRTQEYLSDCLPLIEYMTVAGKKLEQEAIEAASIVARLSKRLESVELFQRKMF